MIKTTFDEMKSKEATINEFMKLNFPILITYKLSRLWVVMKRQYDIYEECRTKLIMKYSDSKEQNPDGNISVKKENIPLFMEEISTLHKNEFELEVEAVKIDLNSLSNLEREITPTMLANLQPYIEFIDN